LTEHVEIFPGFEIVFLSTRIINANTIMKLWLRLALVTMTVGGGFAGFVSTLQSLFRSGASTTNLVLTVLFVGFYACVTASGLLFVHDPTKNRPLVIVLMLQVPCISSSLIVYRFGAGFDLCTAVGGTENASRVEAGFFWDFMLGSRWRCVFGQESPLRIGVNVVALALLLLLWRARQHAGQLIPAVSDSASEIPASPY
jgi:hypothetical protein